MASAGDPAPLARILGQPVGETEQLDPRRPLVMSRFAWIRRDHDKLLVETSLGPCAVVLEDSRAHVLLFAFAQPCPLEAAAESARLPLDAAIEVVALLVAASVVLDAERARAEDEPPLAVWEFHDLMFHVRSRPGRHRNRSGDTCRFLQQFPPAPALPPSRWPDAIMLERPDLERFERDDPPLARVQSARRSIRQHGERPLGLAELGAFLYRVGRVKHRWDVPLPRGGNGDSMSYATKPYPSGGGLYELELYAAIRACDGIKAGLYHYAADRHGLARVSGATADVIRLLADGTAAMGASAEPVQVLIVLSARMLRTAWKYESIAYALVLKHVGVVMQTMYLTATAMQLAPCAIGTGNSDLFARASGIDSYEEPAVGELALGSRPVAPT